MATDWTKQAEEMVKNWTSVQQKMMESMMGMMGMGNMGSTMSSDMWEKTLTTWHDSMKSALEAQVTWTKFWADNIAANSTANKQMNDMSQQAVEMTEKWSSSQVQMLDTWFEALKKTDPATIGKGWNPDEMQKLMQTWQESARKMMESQMEMVRHWTGAPK